MRLESDDNTAVLLLDLRGQTLHECACTDNYLESQADYPANAIDNAKGNRQGEIIEQRMSLSSSQLVCIPCAKNGAVCAGALHAYSCSLRPNRTK